jgi:hypothetical protein
MGSRQLALVLVLAEILDATASRFARNKGKLRAEENGTLIRDKRYPGSAEVSTIQFKLQLIVTTREYGSATGGAARDPN